MMKMWSIFPGVVAGAPLEGDEAGAPEDDVALDAGGGVELLPSALPRIELSDEVEAEGTLGAVVVVGADAGGEAELEPPDDVRPKRPAITASKPEPLKSVLVRIEPSPYRFATRDGHARPAPKEHEGARRAAHVCAGRLSSASGRTLRPSVRFPPARFRARPRRWAFLHGRLEFAWSRRRSGRRR
jgi:hypothetical protein